MSKNNNGFTRLEIDLNVLTANYYNILNAIKPSKLLVVLKDNAYGHGLEVIAKRLAAAGCYEFACATLNEALLLKDILPANSTLIILRALTDYEFSIAKNYNFEFTVNSIETLKKFAKTNRNLNIHLKIETGLGRLGIFFDEINTALEIIKNSANLKLKSVFSHFAVSYQKHEFTNLQLSRFKESCAIIKQQFPNIICHIAATAGVLCLPESYLDMVRISSLLYGLTYTEYLPWGVKPILRWLAPVIHTRVYPADWNIGYRLLYKTSANQKIGVLAVGAGDSYPYSLRLKADVLLHGKRCRVVGMALDQIMIDLSNAPETEVGDEAILIGAEGKDCITAEELAKIAGSSAAEILSKIPQRIPRCYI